MSVRNEVITSKLFIFIVLCAFVGSLNATDITFEIKTPRVVSLGETFRLEYIVKGSREGLNFVPPKSIDGFEIKSGPYISNNIISSGGKSEVWQSYLYILEAQKKGTFAMPLSTIEVDGTEYKTSESQLKVLAENEYSAHYQYGIDAFVKTHVSRAEIYENEAVVLSCQLYTRSPLLIVNEINYPVLADFEVGSKPFYDHQGIPVFTKEEYEGNQYYVGDLRKIIIYPNRTGKLIIPEVEATLTFDVRELDKTKRGYYPGEDRVSGVNKYFKTEPIHLRVVTLPKNKPVDYSEAIGSFKLKSKIKGSQAKVGELFGLRLTVEGFGDLGLATIPVLDLPEGLEIYDMKSEDYATFGHLGLQSDKSFSYLLIAREAGVYRIPPARFVYLDSESGTYKVLTSSEYTVTIKERITESSVMAGL